MSDESTKANARAEIIREAQRILVDQLTDVLTSQEALTKLHALLDGPQTRYAMRDG